MRKSISNRDNYSDRIMRRVVARRDSTNRTQNQHLTSVGACSASTTHKKIPVIERSRNAGFFCKKEGSNTSALRLSLGWCTSAPLHCAWLVSQPNHIEQKKATIHSALRLRSGTRYCVETVRAPSNTRKINI